MKIIEEYKKQPTIIKILDVVFIICFIYEVICTLMNIPINFSVTTLMFLIIVIIVFSRIND